MEMCQCMEGHIGGKSERKLHLCNYIYMCVIYRNVYSLAYRDRYGNANQRVVRLDL